MGRARGWLIALAVLGAAIPLASILPTTSEAPDPNRVRVRLERSGVWTRVLFVNRTEERLLGRYRDPDWSVNVVDREFAAAMSAVRNALIEFVELRWPDYGVEDGALEISEDSVFRPEARPDEPVFEITADGEASWWEVQHLIGIGMHPRVRVRVFEFRLAGTDERLTWIDPSNPGLTGTLLEDVVELRIDAEGVFWLFGDRVAPFGSGLEAGPSAERRRQSVARIDQPRWPDRLVATLRDQAQAEIEAGFLRLAFTSPNPAHTPLLPTLSYRDAFDVLSTLRRLDPAAIFLWAD